MDPYGDSVGEGSRLGSGDAGVNTELTKPDPSAAAQGAIIPSLTDGDIFFDVESFDSDVLLSNSDQLLGIEDVVDDWNQVDDTSKEVDATDEHGLNGLTDSMGSGMLCHDHRLGGDAEAVASSQQVSAHSFNHGKDELEGFKTQHEHSSINHKLSQEASCSTLPEAMGDEDEIQSPSDANVDGQELKLDPREPRVGMEFSSEEAVYNFYSNHAEQTGFSVRRGKTEYSRSNKAIMKAKYFLCSCQGHKSKEQIDKPTRFKRQDTRTDCGAKIKCTVNGKKWRISMVILKHNHVLRGYHAEVLEKAECSHAMTSLSTGKIVDEIRTIGEQALVSNVDCSDVSQGTRKNRLKPQPNDTQDLYDHFKDMQIKDPSFFNTVQGEAAQGMANFFWRDSRSKVDYEHFGDVLVLDTETRINKYDMICAAFWGLNHHRQRIIFGCAVLVDQTAGSFEWLFRSFLEAMSSRKPWTIITEVSEEIANALTVVLPETRHCLSPCSILNSFSKYLSPSSDRPDFRNLFSECVNVHSQEEFESKWKYFVGKYKLHEDTWLASLYRMREKWSHVFTKKVFSAGLLSIQNDEDALFGSLSRETMTLSQIAQCCERAAEYMRRKEFREDMHCEKNKVNLKSRSPMEKEAERLYTRPIFRMFQEELINGLSLAIEETESTGTFCKFKLTEEGSTNIDTVEFDPSNCTLACSCGKFESVGILCFHALKVLNSRNIFKIPSRYLLKRWTKSAKDSWPMDNPSAVISHDKGWVNSFINKFMQKALHVVHICATKKRKRIALEFMDLAVGQIAKAPRTEDITVVRDDSDGNDDVNQTI